MHEGIENFYKGKVEAKDIKSAYFEKLAELEFLDMKFPNENIEANYNKDIQHYLDNFKKIDSKFVLEHHVLFEVLPDIWIQGFVDAIYKGENGLVILDWKTSSKFTGKKLVEAGRQLLLYKLAIEATTNAKVDKIMWCMLKYLNVCHTQKNGKIKKKMCNRGKWVKEMKSALEKEMIKEGIDDLEVSILMEEAVENNNIDILPQFIKDKYWLEDCYVEHEASDENIQELKDYIQSTVDKINSKNHENKDEWKPLDLEKESFYCNNLCNHRNTCTFRKEYVEGLNLGKKNDLLDFDLF